MGEWSHPPQYTAEARAFKESSSELMVRHFAETVLPRLRDIAHGQGYALAVHGSLRRDLDLVAVPWVEDAKPAADLIRALCDGMHVATGWGHLAERDLDSLCKKPHGRLACVIHGSHSVHVDLSVMPRTEKLAQ